MPSNNRANFCFKIDFSGLWKLENVLQVRGSKELEVLLNYDSQGPVGDSESKMNLARLKLAIKYKQKKVA